MCNQEIEVPHPQAEVAKSNISKFSVESWNVFCISIDTQHDSTNQHNDPSGDKDNVLGVD